MMMVMHYNRSLNLIVTEVTLIIIITTYSFTIFHCLFQVGADPDIRVRGGRTLLHEACIGGHTEALKLLLIHVTDMDATDDLGQTACHAAAYHGELGCLKTLEEAGKYNHECYYV